MVSIEDSFIPNLMIAWANISVQIIFVTLNQFRKALPTFCVRLHMIVVPLFFQLILHFRFPVIYTFNKPRTIIFNHLIFSLGIADPFGDSGSDGYIVERMVTLCNIFSCGIWSKLCCGFRFGCHGCGWKWCHMKRCRVQRLQWSFNE